MAEEKTTETTEETSQTTEEAVDGASEQESSTEETEEKTETQESTEEVFAEADLETAKQVYKTLRDPAKGKVLIKSLAESMGLKFETAESKGSGRKEETTVEDTSGKRVEIADLIKENLPAAMQPLAPALTKVMEAVVKQHIESRVSDIAAQQTNNMASNAIETVGGKYKDFEQVYPKMEELAATFQPGRLNGQKDYNTYVERLYKMAKAEVGDTLSVNDTLNNLLGKQSKNIKRAKPSPSSGEREIETTHAKSTSDAIDAAFAALTKKT